MYARRQFGAGVGVVLFGVSGCTTLTKSASTPEENGDTKRLLVASDGSDEVVLLRHGHVANVDGVLDEEENHGSYAVQVELTDDGEDSFYDGLEELDAADDPEAVELYTILDGGIVFTTGITATVAERPDPEAETGVFRISAPDRATAEELQEDLANS